MIDVSGENQRPLHGHLVNLIYYFFRETVLLEIENINV
jgi:hypothetical protein